MFCYFLILLYHTFSEMSIVFLKMFILFFLPANYENELYHNFVDLSIIKRKNLKILPLFLSLPQCCLFRRICSQPSPIILFFPTSISAVRIISLCIFQVINIFFFIVIIICFRKFCQTIFL